ncbi:hypothetical protein DL768_010337 [Monosporascus sp. mg162]|nr:hypothetical protein DL768_010337 [Monosporascus sp. mg162]
MGSSQPNASAVQGKDGEDSAFVPKDSGFVRDDTGGEIIVRNTPPPSLLDESQPDPLSSQLSQGRRRRSTRNLNKAKKDSQKEDSQKASQKASQKNNFPEKPKKRRLRGLGLRARWNAESTEIFMTLLSSYVAENRFAIERPAVLKPVYEDLATDMKSRVADQPWKADTMKAKYMEERKRWMQYLAAVPFETSGDGETEEGIPFLPEEKWEVILKKDLSAAWLRKEPFANKDLYRTAFARETASGEFIREAGDESDLPDRGDVSDESTTSGEDSDEAAEESKPSKAKAGAGKFDPDITVELSGDGGINSQLTVPSSQAAEGMLPPAKRQRSSKKKLKEDEVIAMGFQGLSRVQGFEDVEKAVSYLADNLTDDIRASDFPMACAVLGRGMNPVIFNSLKSKE